MDPSQVVRIALGLGPNDTVTFSTEQPAQNMTLSFAPYSVETIADGGDHAHNYRAFGDAPLGANVLVKTWKIKDRYAVAMTTATGSTSDGSVNGDPWPDFAQYRKMLPDLPSDMPHGTSADGCCLLFPLNAEQAKYIHILAIQLAGRLYFEHQIRQTADALTGSLLRAKREAQPAAVVQAAKNDGLQ